MQSRRVRSSDVTNTLARWDIVVAHDFESAKSILANELTEDCVSCKCWIAAVSMAVDPRTRPSHVVILLYSMAPAKLVEEGEFGSLPNF